MSRNTSEDNNRSSLLRMMAVANVFVICICTLTACASSPPTFLEPQDLNPSWAPDSARVAFVCYRRQVAANWDTDAPYLGPYSGLDNHKLMEICIADTDGRNRHQLTDNTSADSNPAWSPTDDQIAFVSRHGVSEKTDIFVVSSDGTDLVNLTNHPAGYSQPRWSPDGDMIAFISTRDNDNGDLYKMAIADHQVTRLTRVGWISDFSWSPDSAFIVFEGGVSANQELFIVNVDDDSITQITNNRVADFEPAWSPDGYQIAFGSEREDGIQVYLLDIQTQKEVRISDGPDPASRVSWSPDGRFLSYISGRRGEVDQTLRVLELENGNEITFSGFQAIDRVLWSPDSQHLIYERLEDWNGDGFQETKLWILQTTDGTQWVVSSNSTE